MRRIRLVYRGIRKPDKGVFESFKVPTKPLLGEVIRIPDPKAEAVYRPAIIDVKNKLRR